MGARQLVTAWTSGLSVTLPGRGLRWPPPEQPPSSAQPPWAARRLHGGRARLALTGRARLALTVRAWRRRRALHVLVTDVPIEFVAASKHQATGHALLGHRWLLSQHRGISPAARRPLRRRPHTGRSTRSCRDRKSTRLNSSHVEISYAVFCLKKKKNAKDSVSFTIARHRRPD